MDAFITTGIRIQDWPFLRALCESAANGRKSSLTPVQPLLNSLSSTMPNFRKIYKGLVKMYQEEVLGKRVVVQHLFLSEITWGPDIAAGMSASRALEERRSEGEATKAPWAR
jgi:hypothetical protein